MKVDNLITDRLNKLKKTNDNGKINNGLGDNLSENKKNGENN